MTIVDRNCQVLNPFLCSINLTISVEIGANIYLIQSPLFAVSGNLLYKNTPIASTTLTSLKANGGNVVLNVFFKTLSKGIPRLSECIGELGEKGRVVIEFGNGRVDHFIEVMGVN